MLHCDLGFSFEFLVLAIWMCWISLGYETY